MSEMIERVARAIATADWRIDIDENAEPAKWDQAKDAYDLTNNNGRYRFDSIARAAIEAMREPNFYMMENGDSAILYAKGVGTTECWESMIDAALSEKS